MLKAQTMEDCGLEMRRVFQARRETVFRAWTDRDELANWWGPKGFTAHIDTFDPKPGGAYRIDMRSPEGESHWLHGKFRAVEPHERLVLTWIWEQGAMAGHEMLVTVEFTALDDATELRLRHERLPSEAAREAHNEGWSGSFECLTDCLAAT